MKTNDISKGMKVMFADGSTGTMADNKRGNSRRVELMFHGRKDSGDTYMHEVVGVQVGGQ